MIIFFPPQSKDANPMHIGRILNNSDLIAYMVYSNNGKQYNFEEING